MFAGMRTGSNFLEANLNALPDVVCHGEAFNPHFIGKKDRLEYLGVTIRQRDKDPLHLLTRMSEETAGLPGFRFFHDHDPRILEATLVDPDCAKIILTRNPLESYISLKIAQATGQWKLTNPKNQRSARVRFEAAEFEAHLDAQHAFQRYLQHGLQRTGQTAFYLDYEDIGDLAVLNGMAAFLGVEGRLTAPDGALKKQNPGELADKIENAEDMAAALARIDRFDLSRTPNFEPRRGPAIPQVQASAGAPLLYLPIKGGEDPVPEWLAAIKGKGLLGGFGRKELRQWKRHNPGFRSFTVLRHPVVRAYEVFAGQVLTARLPELADALERHLKTGLPDPGNTNAMRTGFLGFLTLAKQALSGQSHLRIAAAWASQSTILQGFAQAHLPDHILREDRLAEGLRWLADEVGVPSPPLLPSPVPAGLAELYDAEIELAVRDAYQRDYVSLGFGAWR